MGDLLCYKVSRLDANGNPDSKVFPPDQDGRLRWVMQTEEWQIAASKAQREGSNLPSIPNPVAVDVEGPKEDKPREPDSKRWTPSKSKRKPYDD